MSNPWAVTMHADRLRRVHRLAPSAPCHGHLALCKPYDVMSSKHFAGGLAGGHQLLLAADLARRSCLTPLLHASRAMRARDVPYGTGGDTHWLPNLYPFPGHVFRGCRTGGMHFDCTTRNQVKREPTISWTEARCGRRVADLPCCARLCFNSHKCAHSRFNLGTPIKHQSTGAAIAWTEANCMVLHALIRLVHPHHRHPRRLPGRRHRRRLLIACSPPMP